MKIEIWSDFVCPFCYIGKRQLDMALEKFPNRDHVFIQFKSYQLDSARSKNDNSIERHALNDRINKQATELGLTINFDQLQHANTFDAHRLVKYADRLGKGSKLTGRLLKAYFTEGKNIEEHLVLLDLAEEVGLSKHEAEQILKTRKYTNAVKEDIDIANEIDVQGVPFFVFNEQYALAGAQSPEVFQEVLETIWHSEDERETKQVVHESKTTYCCGEEPCEEDE